MYTLGQPVYHYPGKETGGKRGVSPKQKNSPSSTGRLQLADLFNKRTQLSSIMDDELGGEEEKMKDKGGKKTPSHAFLSGGG